MAQQPSLSPPPQCLGSKYYPLTQQPSLSPPPQCLGSKYYPLIQQPSLSPPPQCLGSKYYPLTQRTKDRLNEYPIAIETSGDDHKKEFVHDMSNPFYQQQQVILNDCHKKREDGMQNDEQQNKQFEFMVDPREYDTSFEMVKFEYSLYYTKTEKTMSRK